MSFLPQLKEMARRLTRARACTHPFHLSDSPTCDTDFLTRFLED